MSNASYTERFEAVGFLYYTATGYLRPGKDEPAVTGRDSSSPENVSRFEQWFATRAFSDAIERIVVLEKRLEEAKRSAEE